MRCSNCVCPFCKVRSGNGYGDIGKLNCLIIDAVKQVSFSAGEVVFSKGQPSNCMYSLSSGLVKITDHTPDGREQIVGLSNPDALLAGIQSISDDTYQYTAIAATDVLACKISHRALLTAVMNGSEVALRLIGAISAQLAHSRAMMRVLGHKCAAAKIASFIQLIIPESQHGKQRYTLPFSRGDIADLLGLSEETVCRQMARLKRRGVIYAPRGRIEVHDWDQLHAIASEAA
jgi:CRP/FNR family transcriptional regulator